MRTASPRVADVNYVVAGAGKTAIDVGLWLLERESKILIASRWIVPRDCWFINRANVQPGEEFFLQSFGSVVRQSEAIAAAGRIP